MPSFLSHLVHIVTNTQGLLEYDEELMRTRYDLKHQLLTLAQFFEGLRKEDSLDIAERIFQAWRNNAIRDSLSQFHCVAEKLQARRLSAAFWSLRTARATRTEGEESVEQVETSRVQAPLQVPRVADDPYRLSIRKAKKLLSTYSANPQSLGDIEPATARSSQRDHSPADIHERLYQEAALKRHLNSQFEQFSAAAPLKSCTFCPNIDVFPVRHRGNVHERYDACRLYRQNVKTRQVLNHYQRLELESQECTFTPRISNQAQRDNESFNRLYKEAASKRQELRELELQQSERDLSHCTFQPELLCKTERSPHSESVHSALYSQHTERERNVRRQQVERSAREMEEATFAPILYTNQKTESTVPVYQRLYNQRAESSSSRPTDPESLTERAQRSSKPRYQSTGRFGNN